MFALSVYTLQPLILRFATLWRLSQIVSDWIAFFVSFLCCQCTNNLPCLPLEVITTTSNPSIEAYQIVGHQKPKKDGPGEPGEVPRQQQILDFMEQQRYIKSRKDSDNRKIIDIQPKLEEMIMQPDLMPVLRDDSDTSLPAAKNGRKKTRVYPEVHAVRPEKCTKKLIIKHGPDKESFKL